MHYIILGKYTEEGIKNMKDSPKRLEAAQTVAKSFGGEIKQFYLTMGRYDFVSVVEAPSNEAVMKVILTIASAGAIKTETLVALPTEEYKELLKELP
ncbi:MAG: GYD domain-containing protein [Candidatus Hodarchaeales archaeon]